MAARALFCECEVIRPGHRTDCECWKCRPGTTVSVTVPMPYGSWGSRQSGDDCAVTAMQSLPKTRKALVAAYLEVRAER